MTFFAYLQFIIAISKYLARSADECCCIYFFSFKKLSGKMLNWPA